MTSSITTATATSTTSATSTTTHQDTPPSFLKCDGCGQPPWPAGVPLKQCARCHQTAYHNVACQRQHYPQHRMVCWSRSRAVAAIDVAIVKDDMKDDMKADDAAVAATFGRSSPAASDNNSHNSSSSSSSSMVHVEERPHRGKCLIATRDIVSRTQSTTTTATTWTQPTVIVDACAPMVPPVLFSEHRRTHCAVCLQALSSLRQQQQHQKQKTIVLCDLPRFYKVAVCSTDCQAVSRNWLPLEIQAISSAWKHHFVHRPSVQLLPSALLVYRVLVAVIRGQQQQLQNQQNQPHPDGAAAAAAPSLNWHADILNMQSHHHPATTNDPDDEASHHAHATFLLVSTLLHETNPRWPARVMQICDAAAHLHTVVQQVLHRLLCNCFTLTASTTATTDNNNNIDETSEATDTMGFGLFQAPAHCINHSCCPNAVQRFVLAAGQLPRWQLVTTTTTTTHQELVVVAAGTELCIAYIPIDATTTTERRAQLRRTYHFTCTCPRCGPVV